MQGAEFRILLEAATAPAVELHGGVGARSHEPSERGGEVLGASNIAPRPHGTYRSERRRRFFRALEAGGSLVLSLALAYNAEHRCGLVSRVRTLTRAQPITIATRGGVRDENRNAKEKPTKSCYPWLPQMSFSRKLGLLYSREDGELLPSKPDFVVHMTTGLSVRTPFTAARVLAGRKQPNTQSGNRV